MRRSVHLSHPKKLFDFPDHFRLPANPAAVRALKSYGLYAEVNDSKDQVVLILKGTDQDAPTKIKRHIHESVCKHIIQHPEVIRQALQSADFKPVLRKHIKRAISLARGRVDYLPLR